MSRRSRPDSKMGRQRATRVKYRRVYEVPAPITSVRRAMKRHANARRRRADRAAARRHPEET